MRITDVSVPLHNGMLVWPSDPPFELSRCASLAEDGANVSRLSLGSHTGTHVDAPLHLLTGGRSVDQLPLDLLIGPADLVELPGVDRITAPDLERLQLPADCRRLLLRTRNWRHRARGNPALPDDYVAFSLDAARWAVEPGLWLVGIDHLSIGAPGPEDLPVHEALLRAGIVVVEGLDLSVVAPGRYQFICLPLPIRGGDGSPARAVLIAD